MIGTLNNQQFAKPLDRYSFNKKKDLIGKGTYGQVYLAKDLKTGELIAFKKMNVHNESCYLTK